MTQSSLAKSQQRSARSPPPPPPPLCEGWLEKYALCRGFFSSKGWHRRYFFLTHEGIGYSHSNPRERGSGTPGLPLRSSNAKCFIPLEKKRRGEIQLQPVYVIHDVSAARHPAVPQTSHNGICSDCYSMSDGEPPYGSSAAAAAAAASSSHAPISAGSGGGHYYYFGITFEENSNRHLLLLRTDSPQEYLKWTICLPLYLHEGSATRVVPLSHPMEAGRAPPIDVNYRRLTNRRESVLPNSVPFYSDPDPVTRDEYNKIRRSCLAWDEGERQRLFSAAQMRMDAISDPSSSGGSINSSIAELLDRSEDEFKQEMAAQFDEAGADVSEDESSSSPSSLQQEKHQIVAAELLVDRPRSGEAYPIQRNATDASLISGAAALRQNSSQIRRSWPFFSKSNPNESRISAPPRREIAAVDEFSNLSN